MREEISVNLAIFLINITLVIYLYFKLTKYLKESHKKQIDFIFKSFQQINPSTNPPNRSEVMEKPRRKGWTLSEQQKREKVLENGYEDFFD